MAQRLLAYMPAPQTAGNVNNYVSAPPFTSLFYKIDSKVTWAPTSRLNVNARISGLHDDMNSAGLYGGDDNPLSLGTDLNAKIFSYSLAATMTLTPNLVMDVVGGATPPHTYQQPNGPKQCWADIVGIPNACQARDWALPQMEITGFTSRGGTSGGTQPLGNNGFSSSVLDYNDGQSQIVGQPWLDQGQPQREVRRRLSLAAHESLRDQSADVDVLHRNRDIAEWRPGGEFI